MMFPVLPLFHTQCSLFHAAPAKVKEVKRIEADATWLTVGWDAVRPDQCCGFVVNYTVFYGGSTKSMERQLSKFP